MAPPGQWWGTGAVSPCGPGSDEEGPGAALAFPGAWGLLHLLWWPPWRLWPGLGRRRLPGKRLAFQVQCCPSRGHGLRARSLGRLAGSQGMMGLTGKLREQGQSHEGGGIAWHLGNS